MPSGWDAKVAAWLLRTLFAGDIGRDLNEIIKAIYAQYGRAPIAEVEAVLAEMVATGAIARLGPAAWHRAAPPRPAAADVGMVVDAPWFAPIATVLLEALTAAGPDGRTWSELHAAARTSTSRFNSVLNSLVASRQVARLDGLGKARFRMPIAGVDGLGIPPVKSVPIPPFDAPALETEVARLLGAGTTYTLDELVTSARATQLHANRETVRTALDALIAHGRAAIVRLGSMERFHAGTEAAAS